MKKSLILTLGLFVTLIAMTSCGGGDDEARQKAIRDSLYNDSLMQAQAEQARLDSLRNDSLMKALIDAEDRANRPNNTSKPKDKTGSDTGDNTTTTEDPKEEKELTGKDKVKGESTTGGKSGKDAIKGESTTGGKSGKDKIKGK